MEFLRFSELPFGSFKGQATIYSRQKEIKKSKTKDGFN